MGKKRREFLYNIRQGQEPSRNLVTIRKSEVFMRENMEYTIISSSIKILALI
jgi:hypothetical protein